MAIYALKNNLLFGGDAGDAYAHAWANFSQRTFVRVDAPYIEWYQARHGVKLDLYLLFFQS